MPSKIVLNFLSYTYFQTSDFFDSEFLNCRYSEHQIQYSKIKKIKNKIVKFKL